MKVGVHQGSVLSPLLFIIVLEALSKKFRIGLPWELFYADDLAPLAESEEKLLEMIKSSNGKKVWSRKGSELTSRKLRKISMWNL